MGKTKLDETYIFNISIKMQFFVTIGIKFPLFRVSVTIQPGSSLLQFVTTNCVIILAIGKYTSIFQRDFLGGGLGVYMEASFHGRMFCGERNFPWRSWLLTLFKNCQKLKQKKNSVKFYDFWLSWKGVRLGK